MQTNSRDVDIALGSYKKKKILKQLLQFSPNIWLTSHIQINHTCAG